MPGWMFISWLAYGQPVPVDSLPSEPATETSEARQADATETDETTTPDVQGSVTPIEPQPVPRAPAPVAPPPAVPVPIAPPTQPSLSASQEATDNKSKPDMGLAFRGRYLSVPKSILDIWYFDADDEGWPAPTARPRLEAYSLGLEYTLQAAEKNTSGVFYIEYAGSLMSEGYWDDREEPADHFDGDYLVPSKSLGFVGFGANYIYQAPFVRPGQTNGAFGMNFMVGVGLGVAVRVGGLQRWGPCEITDTDCNHLTDYALRRYLEGTEPDAKKQGIPRVLPLVDILSGVNFLFGERLTLRLEGGLHTMLYYGGSLGVQF